MSKENLIKFQINSDYGLYIELDEKNIKDEAFKEKLKKAIKTKAPIYETIRDLFLRADLNFYKSLYGDT